MKWDCRIWIAFFSTAVGSYVWGASAETAELLDRAAASIGAEYRNRADELLERSNLTQALEAAIAAPAMPWTRLLVARILLARVTHPDLFRELEGLVKSSREPYMPAKTKKPIPRPGVTAGMLLTFATRGPESRFVEVLVGTHLADARVEKVERYTDAEVAAGKARNATARLAVVEYAIKYYPEATEREQRELLEAVWEMGPNARLPACRDATIPAKAIMEEAFQDTSRPLSVRATALRHLPDKGDETMHDLMLKVLTSEETSNPREHGEVVRQAVYYLKEHDTERLKKLQAKPRWKQAEINAALGLPAPPPSEEDLRREREELQTE
jgi:hypothetical protein